MEVINCLPEVDKIIKVENKKGQWQVCGEWPHPKAGEEEEPLKKQNEQMEKKKWRWSTWFESWKLNEDIKEDGVVKATKLQWSK